MNNARAYQSACAPGRTAKAHCQNSLSGWSEVMLQQPVAAVRHWRKFAGPPSPTDPSAAQGYVMAAWAGFLYLARAPTC
jgi:hypothetical protein